MKAGSDDLRWKQTALLSLISDILTKYFLHSAFSLLVEIPSLQVLKTMISTICNCLPHVRHVKTLARGLDFVQNVLAAEFPQLRDLLLQPEPSKPTQQKKGGALGHSQSCHTLEFATSADHWPPSSIHQPASKSISFKLVRLCGKKSYETPDQGVDGDVRIFGPSPVSEFMSSPPVVLVRFLAMWSNEVAANLAGQKLVPYAERSFR